LLDAEVRKRRASESSLLRNLSDSTIGLDNLPVAWKGVSGDSEVLGEREKWTEIGFYLPV